MDARAPEILASPAEGARSLHRPIDRARRLFRTHAFRLAALYSIIFAASVLGVLLFVYLTSADFVERQTEATLEAEIAGLGEQYAQRGLSGLVQIVAARSAGDRGDAMLYLVSDDAGRSLAGNIAAWPAGGPVTEGWLAFTFQAHVHGTTETHPARGRLFEIPGGYRLLVGRDISDAAAFRTRIRTTLSWAGLVALVLGVGGGTVMSRTLLQRVEEVNRTSERVMAGNLSDRIPLAGTSDEFDQLAFNLNSMLDQIERLMSGMREVTDNVAHDLKTPLARLRGRLELALLGEGDVAAQRAAIAAGIDDADGLLATFNALLSIAEAESGARRDQAAPIALSTLVEATTELYEPVTEEKGFTLVWSAAPGTVIRGDRHLLSQALANLLDNALKYAGGGEIRIEAGDDGSHAFLSVADHGPGIPAGMRETVLDRFVRLDSARSTPGNGLGLSLVRAVAQLHGGTVTLLDNEPGLKVRLSLPMLAEGAVPSLPARR